MHVTLVVAVCAVAAALVAADTIYVMGDWGGWGSSPYYDGAETNVAAAMQAGAAQTGAQYTIALGDNFYQEGISTDVNDPRFKETFEDIFSGSALQGPDYKFYVLAGNHDYYGNISAQVAYSGKSNRWVFPELWYTFTKKTSDGATIQFVMIDTVVLSGNSPSVEVELPGDQLPGPADEKLAVTQWTWIQQTLAASKADYLIVAGHYPVWSVCEHGPTTVLVSKLKPLLEKYKATAYLAGHDHCAEYIDEGTGVQYHGVGASHGADASVAHKSSVPAGSLKFHYDAPSDDLGGDDVNPKVGAFALITADKNGLQVQHLADSGDVIYSAPTVQPRN